MGRRQPDLFELDEFCPTVPTLHNVDDVEHQAEDDGHEVVALGTWPVVVAKNGRYPVRNRIFEVSPLS